MAWVEFKLAVLYPFFVFHMLFSFESKEMWFILELADLTQGLELFSEESFF